MSVWGPFMYGRMKPFGKNTTGTRQDPMHQINIYTGIQKEYSLIILPKDSVCKSLSPKFDKATEHNDSFLRTHVVKELRNTITASGRVGSRILSERLKGPNEI